MGGQNFAKPNSDVSEHPCFSISVHLQFLEMILGWPKIPSPAFCPVAAHFGCFDNMRLNVDGIDKAESKC